MMPQAFTNLIEACNTSIVILESCIAAADSCEDLCEKKETCKDGALNFIERAKECIEVCQSSIKVCDEMIVQFKSDSHEEHIYALENAVKMLGECVRTLRSTIDSCTTQEDCLKACQEARNVCERTLIAVDECLESCERHEYH